MFECYEKKHLPTTCGSCNVENMKNHEKHSEWKKHFALHKLHCAAPTLNANSDVQLLCVSNIFNLNSTVKWNPGIILKNILNYLQNN